MRIKPEKGAPRTHSDLYDAYINSDAWRTTRAAALARAAFACQAPGCAETAGLEVHHTTYDHLGAEAWSELRVLCAACHRAADVRRVETMKLSRRLKQVRDDVRGGR